MLDYQNSKLKEIVAYAGKYVSYYRNLFREIGLDTSTFRGIEDLQKIPLLDKETLRTRQNEFIADTAHILDSNIEKTSGSTGTPLTMMIDRHSRANKYAAYARAYRWAGYRPGALRFVLKGLSETKSKAWGYDALRNMIYLNSSKMNKDTCMATAKLVAKLTPSVFEGYARSFIDFHKLIQNEFQFTAPRGIFVYGESVTSGIREHVQSAFGAHLYDFYSHAENSVMICEKPDHKKYLMEDYFYPEIVTTEGNPAEDGYGELAGTSFYNYAMPLIRYKTRDYIKLADRQDGAFQEVLEIEGRKDNYIELSDGRKIYIANSQLSSCFTGRNVANVQIVQDTCDHVFIMLKVDKGFSKGDLEDIKNTIPHRFGTYVEFDVLITDDLIKQPSGKTPFIVSKLR